MSNPQITTTENGPFIAQGLTVRETDYVVSENDEPMTWSFGDVIAEPGDSVALCRCGQSKSRPFCDGTHNDVEWDSRDQHRPEQPYTQRARHLDGPADAEQDYTLLDDTPLCMHAGQCATERRSVWQMLPDTDDSQIRGVTMRMVEKCPSGRLTNVLDGIVIEPSLPTEINVIPGGPLWATGGISIVDEAGNPLEERNRVTLCRCGASENKPLCDGSHSDIGFESDKHDSNGAPR